MKITKATPIVLLTCTLAAAHAVADEPPVVSHLPAKGLGQLIVDRLDITTFRSSLGPRRRTGQRHFADLGIKPASVTDELVDMSDDITSITIRVLERRDQNGDGIEDIAIRIADLSKTGTYAAGESLLVTRFSADGDLIALAFEPTEPEPAASPRPAADSPEGVVAALYKAHANDSSPLFQSKDRARLDQTFTKPFADLIWQDANHAEGELGAISADPLIDAQDGEPRNLEFIAGKPQGGKVLVTASFQLLGKVRRVRFRMEQADGTWKIADILGNDFTSLRETLAKAYPGKGTRAR